jgi:uncharacterized membrane protein
MSNLLLILAVCIGIVAGLRALTGPAVICWMAHLGYFHLGGTRLAFMASIAAVIIFTMLALGEIVNDKLPKTPPRTAPPAFGARILMAILGGSALAMAAGGSVPMCALMGLIGAVIGTYGGYFARTGVVKALHSSDLPIAVLEDLVAIGGAILIVWKA